jgi:hypothetical protein
MRSSQRPGPHKGWGVLHPSIAALTATQGEDEVSGGNHRAQNASRHPGAEVTSY